ncbi:MAG: hypothetical protein RL065_164 [Bacteroidota bacterium]|jgi:hypothetical protein
MKKFKLLKTIILAMGCFLAFSNSYSQITNHTIPFAQQQPKWVMPLWFEDAIGQKDTIYFCYAPKIEYYGSPPHFNNTLYNFYKTQYGMNPIKLDSNKMVIGKLEMGDSVSKVFEGYITSISNGDSVLVSNAYLIFKHTVLPLVMKWDPKVFYNDSLDFLPKKNGITGPRGQGGWLYDPNGTYINNCGWSEYALMTDTVQPFFNSTNSCINRDSMVFSGVLTSTTIIVYPWIGYVGAAGGIEEIINDKFFKINPNPVDEILNIKFARMSDHFNLFNIIDVFGRVQLTGKIKTDNNSISIENLPNGIYIIRITESDNSIIHSSKFIKQSK